MNLQQKVSRFLALAATGMIMACGGGSGGIGSVSSSGTTGTGGTTSTPPTRAPANASIFLEFAKNQDCANVRNRYYLIDNQYVFQDKAGACGDMSYARVLYGATPNEVLCSEADSIAGPQIKCDAAFRSLFDTINANRNSANLGLGTSRSVTPLQTGTSLPYRVLDSINYSGMQLPQNRVIKDSNAWASLWAQHANNQVPAPALPTIDFSRKMLVALFSGNKPNGCYGIGSPQVERIGTVIRVSYVETEPGSDPNTVCTQSITSPALLLEIDRSDAPVELTNNRFGVALTVK
jgi:hypothetical protein